MTSRSQELVRYQNPISQPRQVRVRHDDLRNVLHVERLFDRTADTFRLTFRPEAKVVRISHITGGIALINIRSRASARQGNQIWIVVQAQGNDVSETFPNRRKIEGCRLVDFVNVIISKVKY